MYNVPILLVIFKRKEVALKTLEPIKALKPSKLYIAGDGARPNIDGEKEKVEETRNAVLNYIDWECEVKTRFSDKNQGCSLGVYNAINWLFDNEERGIIIEDDCIMQDSFFRYVEELLELYNNDNRVGMICGANYANGVKIPDSYVFSRYKSCHGWATWKRAWKLMDIDMKWRETPYAKSVIANMGYKAKDIRYWKYRLTAIDLNDVSAWDWQWYFTLAANNMLAICPKHTLTTNIGFGKDATHTCQAHIPSQYIANEGLTFPLRHPSCVAPYMPFEKFGYPKHKTIRNKIQNVNLLLLRERVKKALSMHYDANKISMLTKYKMHLNKLKQK